jgi:hypothetical protein
MAPTVHALRNEIRVSVGRYERVESTGFTKEALAALCESLGADAHEGSGTAAMRAAIRGEVGLDAREGAFRKAELEAIAEALRE